MALDAYQKEVFSAEPVMKSISETGESGHRCRFLIVTQPRSGSYHLASLLGSAPDVTCLGEIFKDNRVELPPWLRKKIKIGGDEVWLRDIDPQGYLASLMSYCDKPIFGFKEFSTRLFQSGIGKQTLRSQKWRKIFLMRNPIRKYVSLQRARETGAYKKNADTKQPDDNIAVRFDPVLFEETLRLDISLRSTYEKLKEARPRRNIALDYRELNDPEVLMQLLGFIRSKGDVEQLQSTYYRQNPLPLEQSLTDYDVMVRYMKKNGYNALLKDALIPDA